MKGHIQHQYWKDRKISAKLEDGWSYRAIADDLSVSFSRITSVASNQDLQHRRGRPPKYTEEIRKFIETNTQLNARLTNEKMAQMVEQQFGTKLDRTTIGKIRRDLHFSWRPSFTIQALTPEQKFLRAQFAKDMLELLEHPEYKDMKIVFSDESRFCLQSDGFYCWVQRGKWNQTACKEKNKYNNGVMFWGAISTDYKSPLVKCTGTVGQEEYLKILEESGVFSAMDGTEGRFRWMFMQDGAPAHTASKVIEVINGKSLIIPGWPPNSPHLNPIELLWAIVKARVHASESSEDVQLEAISQAAWNEIHIETINSLVASFKDRLRMVLQMNGESISQLLSSHLKEPTPEMIVEHNWSFFTSDEDERLLQLHDQFGNQWKRIAGMSEPERERTVIKHRIEFLTRSKGTV